MTVLKELKSWGWRKWALDLEWWNWIPGPAHEVFKHNCFNPWAFLSSSVKQKYKPGASASKSKALSTKTHSLITSTPQCPPRNLSTLKGLQGLWFTLPSCTSQTELWYQRSKETRNYHLGYLDQKKKKNPQQVIWRKKCWISQETTPPFYFPLLRDHMLSGASLPARTELCRKLQVSIPRKVLQPWGHSDQEGGKERVPRLNTYLFSLQ